MMSLPRTIKDVVVTNAQIDNGGARTQTPSGEARLGSDCQDPGFPKCQARTNLNYYKEGMMTKVITGH